MHKTRHHLPVGEMFARIATHRHSAIRGTMVRLILGDDLIAFGVHPRNLDGILHRLGPTKCKERFSEVTRCNFRNLFTKYSSCFGYHAGIHIAYLFHLPCNGLGYPLIAMPDVYIHQLRRKINVSFSICAIQVHAFCFYHINRVQPGLFAPGK
jgi:hypothetical protein